MGLSSIAARILSPAYGRTRYQRYFRWLHNASLLGKNIGGTIDVAASGEVHVIDLLLRAENKSTHPVIFDVGTNRGDWSHLAMTAHWSKFAVARVRTFVIRFQGTTTQIREEHKYSSLELRAGRAR